MTDQRSPRARRAWIVVALAAAMVWIVDLGLFGHGVPHLLDDTWEYAVAAQHLLAGDGFVTRVIHPPLWGLADGTFRVPLLIHGPLMPLVLTPALALFGPGVADGIAWLSAGCAALAATLIFVAGARRSLAVGLAAALLFTLSPRTIGSVHHDVALTAGAALLAATLLALFPSGAARPRTWRTFAGGLLLGGGYLVRPEFLLLTPLLPLALGRAAAPALAGFAFAALPWWTHHALAVGAPFFNLSSYLVIGYHGRYPDLTVLRDFSLPPDAWPAALREALPGLPEKWAATLPRAIKRALLAPTAATGALAALGALVLLAAPATRRRAALGLAAALIPVAVMTLTIYDDRYLAPFLPLWALAAAIGAATLAARLPHPVRSPRVWVALLAVLALPSAARAFLDAELDAPAARAALAAERDALAALPRSPRPLFTDVPDFAAWSTGRATIWVTREEHLRLLPCADEAAVVAPDGRPCRGGPDDVRFRP